VLEKELAAEGGSKLPDQRHLHCGGHFRGLRHHILQEHAGAFKAVCQPSAFAVLAARGVRDAIEQLPASMHARFDSSVACCRLPRQCLPDRHSGRDDPVRGVPVQLLDAERYLNVVVYLDGLSQRPAFKETFQPGST